MKLNIREDIPSSAYSEYMPSSAHIKDMTSSAHSESIPSSAHNDQYISLYNTLDEALHRSLTVKPYIESLQ